MKHSEHTQAYSHTQNIRTETHTKHILTNINIQTGLTYLFRVGYPRINHIEIAEIYFGMTWLTGFYVCWGQGNNLPVLSRL